MDQGSLLVAGHLAHVEDGVVHAAARVAHLLGGRLTPARAGSQVLSELLYVPPAAVHILDVLILAVPEHAASGRASRATMAVVNNIFLEPIVASCWLMDVSLFWSETPTAPTHPTTRRALPPPAVIPAAYLSASGRKLAVLWGLSAMRHHAPTPEQQRSRGAKETPAGAFTPRRVGS